MCVCACRCVSFGAEAAAAHLFISNRMPSKQSGRSTMVASRWMSSYRTACASAGWGGLGGGMGSPLVRARLQDKGGRIVDG